MMNASVGAGSLNSNDNVRHFPSASSFELEDMSQANENGEYKPSEVPYNNGKGGTGGAHSMDTQNHIEKYIDRLDQDRRDMEQRLREDRSAMENRIEQRFADANAEWNRREERIENRFSEVMAKMDRSIDKADETKRWVIGVCIATILGIAAMIITVVLS